MATANLSRGSVPIRHVLITGAPGFGKTTLVQKVLDSPVLVNQFPVCGFLTQEVRDSTVRRRVGFDVISLQGYPDGHRMSAPLARTRESSSKPLPVGPNVGNYVVDVHSFESVALSAMTPKQQGKENASLSKRVLCVLDEIGKMELLSGSFQKAVRQTMTQDKVVVLATVPLVSKGKGLSLVEELKARNDIKIFEVTRENRNELVAEVVQLLKTILLS